jgi:SsrA-binding protein
MSGLTPKLFQSLHLGLILRAMKKADKTDTTIAQNRKAHHDYFIEDRFEAGLVLEGWEVKSLREGRVQLDQAHVIIKHGAAFLFGSLITPLQTALTHIHPDPQRTRKLLLHQSELSKLVGSIERRGYTVVPLSLYWKNNRVKMAIGLAKGKKLHDKRDTEKQRDWAREKQRLLKKPKI